MEHAAKSKLVTDLVQFLTNFSLERVLRGLILKTAEDRLQSGELNKDGARHLSEQRDEFLSSFDTITGWPDNPEHRQVVLTTVLAAFAIGLRGHAQEDLRQGVRQTLTKAANDARRAEPVQEITELLAREFWKRRPSFKGNDLGTAKNIHDAVTDALLERLETNPKAVPSTWHPLENPTKADVKKATNRIAGRLKRIKRSDR